MTFETIRDWLPVIIAAVGVVGIYYGLKGKVEIHQIKIDSLQRNSDKLDATLDKNATLLKTEFEKITADIKNDLKNNTDKTDKIAETVNTIKTDVAVIKDREHRTEKHA